MRKSVDVKQVKHIVTRQYEAEQSYLKAAEGGNYTYDYPFIKVNPYFIAPLTALMIFKTTAEVAVSITVKGKEKEGDISWEFPKNTTHILPILGLYAGYNNTVEVTLSSGEKGEVKIPTELLPEEVKAPIKIQTTSDYMQGNLMFLTSAMAAKAGAYDYKGDCRWYTTEDLTFDLERIRNGRLLVGSSRFLAKPYNTVGIYEMGMIGKVYTEYRLPGGYHHDKWEMEDGNILILTQDFQRGTVEDMCVLVDRQTGEVLKTWDYQTILPMDVAKSGSWSEEDWFHNNAVWYDKKTHTLTFSGRHQDIIINIDYETGKLNWMLGDPEGWPQELVDQYFFKPVGETFEWHYEPHACVILPGGDVMVFDNGHYRSKNPQNYIANKDNYSRGVRYEIDTENMTIKQVWQYGKERGHEFFSPYISNVEYYGEGHYMVHSGGIAYKDGVTTENLGAREKRVDPNVELLSTTVELVDDEVKYEITVPANYYRGEKLPLYVEGDVLTLGKGKVLGKFGKTAEFETGIEGAEVTGEIVPDKYKIEFKEEEDRIIFKGMFEKGQLVMLILEDAKGEQHRYYISTAASDLPNGAMCLGLFQASDEREITFNINKEGLNGHLTAKMIIDMQEFNTGAVFHI